MPGAASNLERSTKDVIAGAPGKTVLLAGFGVLLMLIALGAALVLHETMQVEASLQSVITRQLPRMALARNMRFAARERAMTLYSLANTDDPFERDELVSHFYELGSDFMKERESLERLFLSTEEKAFLERHREVAREIAPLQREVLSMLNSGDVEQARRMLVERVVPGQFGALKHIDDLIRYEDAQVRERLGSERELAAQARVMIAISSALALLIGVIIAAVVIRHLGRLIRMLSMAQASLEQRVEERTRELADAKETLRHMAHYDALTGLPNRLLFQQLLDKALQRAQRRKMHVALMFLDLDGFKSVNDRFGHAVGDGLLREAAVRMQGLLRGEDVVARLGGDEFTVLLGDMHDPRAGASEVARKLIEAISAPFLIEECECLIGTSIGIALYPDDVPDGAVLLEAADHAMYRVKAGGKNDFTFYRPGDDADKK